MESTTVAAALRSNVENVPVENAIHPVGHLRVLTGASAQLFMPLVPCPWAVIQVHHDGPFHERELPVHVPYRQLHVVPNPTAPIAD